MNLSTVIGEVATYAPVAITAAAAAAAALPASGPAWWVETRRVIDLLAFNFGNAANGKKP